MRGQRETGPTHCPPPCCTAPPPTATQPCAGAGRPVQQRRVRRQLWVAAQVPAPLQPRVHRQPGARGQGAVQPRAAGAVPHPHARYGGAEGGVAGVWRPSAQALLLQHGAAGVWVIAHRQPAPLNISCTPWCRRLLAGAPPVGVRQHVGHHQLRQGACPPACLPGLASCLLACWLTGWVPACLASRPPCGSANTARCPLPTPAPPHRRRLTWMKTISSRSVAAWGTECASAGST